MYVKNIRACHRCPEKTDDGNGLFACVDGHDIQRHAKAGDCPRGRYGDNPSLVQVTTPAKPPPPTGWAAKGPRLWAQLHRDALAGRVDAAYLLAFRRQIGCGGCQADWIKWEAANRPPVGDAAAVFEWSWKAHSAVNVRLGKPEMTLAEAWTRWG